MTEDEWVASADPTPMLESLTGALSLRKLRLFACGCCRRIWRLLCDQRSHAAVEVAERHADGFADDKQLANASAKAEQAFHSIPWEPNGGESAAKLAASAVWGATAMNLEETVFGGQPITGFANNTALQAGDAAEDQKAERAAQAELLRDVFGNPFRRATIDSAWLRWNDSTVVKLAQSVYEQRTFDLLPILADALENAGCDNTDILNHCRQPGEHVKGCWVIDSILGKE